MPSLMLVLLSEFGFELFYHLRNDLFVVAAMPKVAA
jgi:hypothetical protein